jgi:hypothetical protein
MKKTTLKKNRDEAKQKGKKWDTKSTIVIAK